MPKPQTIAASEARNNFSDLISKVQYQGQVYLVERYGEVVAKIMPAGQEAVVDDSEITTEVESQPKEQVQKIEQLDQSRQSDEINEDERKPDERVSTQFSYRQVSSMGRTIGMPSSIAPVQESAKPFENKNTTLDELKLPPQMQVNQTQSQAEQTESSLNEHKDDSGWSALKKLEELIAAQRAKSTQQQNTFSERTAQTASAFGGDAGLGLSLGSKGNGEGMSDETQPTQQIIRKKIEL